MDDPFLTYRGGTTGQTVRVILYRGATAWNPVANGGAGGWDTLTAGNWAQHLLTPTDPQSLGHYTLDLSGLTPALPAGPFSACFYVGTAAGAAPVAGTGALWWTGATIAGDAFTANGNRLSVPATDEVTPQVIAPLPVGTLLAVIGGNGAYNLTQDGGVGASGAAITLNGVALTTDALRVLDANNQPVLNAAVQLFLATDTTYTAFIGTTITGVDGRWVGPVKANSGSYTLLVAAQGDQVRVVTGISIP